MKINLSKWLPLVLWAFLLGSVSHAAEAVSPPPAAEDDALRREEAFQNIYDALDEDMGEAERFMELTRTTNGAGPMYLVGDKPLESLDTEALEEVGNKGFNFITQKSIEQQRQQRAELKRIRDQQDLRNSMGR